MTKRVVKCRRCNKRHRTGQTGWNEDYVAGLVIGYSCPDCQTAEESMGAEVNFVLNPPSSHRKMKVDGQSDVARIIEGLVNTYRTSEVLRVKADLLSASRRDVQATEMARLMRKIADAMDSGELWED